MYIYIYIMYIYVHVPVAEEKIPPPAPRFLASFVTRFLARVLTRALGMGKTIIQCTVLLGLRKKPQKTTKCVNKHL